MRLLVTRPHDDAQSLAQVLRARGHEPVLAPMLEVRYQSGPPLTLEGVQAVLATSGNGVRAFAMRNPKRDLTVYAVGPQTAEAARSAGFPIVINAEGDSSALVETVAREADPAKGLLLHAAGAETAGRLRQALQARGFAVETVVLYDAVPVNILPHNAAEALRDGSLDAVLLFSPRSAKVFTGLVTDAELAPACAKLTAYCISAATAAELTSLSFGRIAVAGAPNQDAMLDLIRSPGAS